jgi:hypothetical protein
MLGREDLKSLAGHTDVGPRAIPSTTGASSRRSASAKPACFRSRSTPSASRRRRAAGTREGARRRDWPNYLFVGASCRTRRSRTISSSPSTSSATSPNNTGSSSSARPTPTPTYYMAVQGLINRYRMPAGPVHVHRPGARRGSGDVLPDGRRLHFALGT